MSVPGKIGVEEYVDNFLAENSALRRKLQSKAEALLILSKELDQCRTERDQFKLMAEQLQDRYSMLKKKSHDMDISRLMLYSDGVDGRRPGSSLMQVLSETREQNKILKIEVEDLRQKLRDSQGDIKALRIKLGQQRTNTNTSENQSFPSHQREELVQQLETLSLKCTQLGADLQALLDEKEELVTERDAYKCKVHRLNHELNTLLKGNGKKLVDIDALVMENRYLQERLKQAEEEKELSNQALYKYKSMLDKKRSKGTVKLGTNSNTGMVMSHKQVQQLLEKGTSAQLPNTAATLSDMKSLCLALLEALGDKTLALAHQKKANKILATRISELEQRLEAAEGGHVAAFPSQLLLEGYTSSEVDHDVGHILSSSTRTEQSDSEGECINNVGRENQHVEEVKQNTSSEDTSNTLNREEKSNYDSLSKQDQTSAALKISARSKLPEKRPVVKGCDADENEIGVVAWTNRVSDNGDLPPQLQLLVQKALEEIKKEPKSGC